jgi:hypothetical protein
MPADLAATAAGLADLAAAADAAAVATAVAADTGKNFAAFPGTCGIPQKGPSASADGPFCCAERERLFSTLPILTEGFFRR